ncbi:hypothetical protein IFM89_036973 [Coptis chinensis]|uniref:Uncharacterized protein n=1 Tax=Coptis chinensis TaxID=261450 RepID=A0A835HAT8_9MAGN|nr:hypothetical protein IFM89_036973 [Coptis chinensis]
MESVPLEHENVTELVLVALQDGVEEGRRFSNEERDPMTSKELNEEPYEFYAPTYYPDIPREMYGLMRLTTEIFTHGWGKLFYSRFMVSLGYMVHPGEIELQEIVNGLINTQMYNSPWEF